MRYFGLNSFYFLSFLELKTDALLWTGGGGQRGGEVGHIGTGILLSACLPLNVFCFMFEVKVEVSILSVHGPKFKRSECMYIIL